MLLGLRSILPLSLSGVLAFLGLWWYSARKKGRLPATPPREEEGVAKEQSPGQVGGEGQERGGLAGKGKERGGLAGEEQERRGLAGEEQERGGLAGEEQERGGLVGEEQEKRGQAEEEQEEDLAASTQQDAALLSQSQPQDCAWRPEVASEQVRPDAVCEGKGSLLSHPCERPEPEGEVGEGSITLRFTEKLPHTEEPVLSKDLHPALSSAAGPLCGPWPPVPDVSVEEMNQVAAGVINDVVSLAVAEILRGRSLQEEAGLQSCAQGSAPLVGEATVSPTLLEDRMPDNSSGSQALLAGSTMEPAEDSSSTQSEDSSSEEDYPAWSCPEEEQSELGRRQGTARGPTETLRNGLSVEEEPASGCGLTSLAPEEGQFSPQPSPSPDPPGALAPPQTSGPLTVWEFEVPKHLVGRLIGKQGRYVSFLKENSGAKVFISTLPFTQEVQLCHIEGTKEQVDVALDLIRMKFKDLELSNCYVPPPSPSLPALPVTSWLLLPQRVTVEVRVAQVASGNYLFVQQHTHPTFHALHSLDQQMRLCYAQPSCPALPAPVEVGVICAGQLSEGAWGRAQVMRYHPDSREVEVRYVDYGGYDTVPIDSLRQIRSDFVSLPFQGSEVILDNLACLPGEEEFSTSAKAALEKLTLGASLLAQVTDFHSSGIPLVQLWRKEGSEVVSVNQALVEGGFCCWINRP